ncbi:MAG: exo-alpha-sialidase, partial [Clostridiales bacterium]|nr:exo-alpha-sialidase [Clostridiales bacterium]
YDADTDTIWLFYCHTPGGVGLWNSRPGKGVDKEGNRYLYDVHNNRFVLRDGVISSESGEATSLRVDEAGYVYKEDELIGNIFKGTGPLLEERTSFLEVVYSKDDGLTWSKPINLNGQVKEEWMKFIGPGPGVGIQMTTEKYKGRLVVPIYFSNHTNAVGWTMSCCLIISDDHGQTWTRGNSPNDGRLYKGEAVEARTLLDYEACLTESQVVELNDGRLLYMMRNHDRQKRTARAYSEDGGMTWSQVEWVDEFEDPTCQSSLIKYPDLGDGKERILFANPGNEKERKKGTVRLSEDGGQTFPYAKVIKEDDFVYNSMAVLQDGTIGMLYEGRDDMKEMEFIKFTLDWIKE